MFRKKNVFPPYKLSTKAMHFSHHLKMSHSVMFCAVVSQTNDVYKNDKI